LSFRAAHGAKGWLRSLVCARRRSPMHLPSGNRRSSYPRDETPFGRRWGYGIWRPMALTELPRPARTAHTLGCGRRARVDRLLPRRGPRAADRRRARRVDHYRPRRLKRRDLESHVRGQGRELLREGARYAIWINCERDLRAPVPRRRDIPAGTRERSAASSGSRHQPAHTDRPAQAAGSSAQERARTSAQRCVALPLSFPFRRVARRVSVSAKRRSASSLYRYARVSSRQADRAAFRCARLHYVLQAEALRDD
jgi:hypothetical protein